MSVGQNTYPYVHGVIWEPVEDSKVGRTVTMVSNRPGGMSLSNIEQDTLDFFLTRKISNVNIDKGLPNRLDDTQ